MQTALHALYGHYEQTFEAWRKAGIEVPPVFIVVCNNTSASKLVHDFIAGFQRESDDSSTTLENGRLALFRNYDEHGNRLARPRTLLISSNPARLSTRTSETSPPTRSTASGARSSSARATSGRAKTSPTKIFCAR